MEMIRKTAAVLAGYFIFALASMAVISLLGSLQGPISVVVALAALAVTGFLAGLVVRVLAGGGSRWPGYTTGGLVALATVANLLLRLGAEPVWYKTATLVLTVPLLLLVSRPRASGGHSGSSPAVDG